jgi:ABC-2 type transport system permease protein
MFFASVYIIVCSARNRLRMRLRRLRQPRYLVGAIAGAVYLYFSVFARMRSASRTSALRRGRRAPAVAPEALRALYASGPALVGVFLLVTTIVGWLMPFDSGLLDFSEAEVQFLFPAPVQRRQLLIHRMMRSQLGMLFGSVVVAAFSPLDGMRRVQIAVGVWFLFATTKVYFTGISLSRARLTSADARARRVAWLPVAVLAVALTVVGTAAMRAWIAQPASSLQQWLVLVGGISASGASRVALWPFVAIAKPLFAEWPGPFFYALAGSAAVLAGVVGWVLASDEAFQDAAADAVERRDSGQAATRVNFKARATGLRLNLTGRPELAFAWKAAQQTLRVVDRRSLARLAAIIFSVSVAAVSIGRANGLAAVLGAFAIIGVVFSVLMAPQALRIDMREDMRHLEVLKTWPVPPAALIRGELLWPGVLLTGVAWLALALALFLSTALFANVNLALRVSAAIAIAILAPALIFAQFTIHNGVALIFPAWVPLGNQRARGLDAMGQRLILLGGTWLLLIAMAVPGALAGGIVWLAFRRIVGAAVFVPAALVCASILAIEVLAASEALGPAYERLDITAVESAEQ